MEKSWTAGKCWLWDPEVACFAAVAEQCHWIVLILHGLTGAQSVPEGLDLAHYISLSN